MSTPWTGFFHFYGDGFCRKSTGDCVSTPWTGFFHFYTPSRFRESNLKMLCQRPERASFISTQNTLTGNSGLMVCQRPERASFISTRYIKRRKTLWRKVSTPWTGFFHFYTLMCICTIFAFTACVNALNGLLSFLRKCQAVGKGYNKDCVNALNGLLSFLPTTRKVERLQEKMVCQRPERAYFISTLAYFSLY